MAQGNPALRSIPTWANNRHDSAAAMVSPEAAITGATLPFAMPAPLHVQRQLRRCS